MRYLFSLIASVFVVLALVQGVAFAQGTPQRDVVSYIAMLDNGNAGQVRKAMPRLITQFENSPELTYLQARLEPDGMEAAKLYRGILENYPKCDYADEALLHVYQYDYMSGLYQSADQDLKRLRKEYPSSPVLASVNEVVVPLEKAQPAQSSGMVASQPNDGKRSAQMNAKQRAAFSLQVGAFTTTVNAEKLKQKFEKLGYPVEISNKVMEQKTLYVVWVGSFTSAEQARAEASKLRTREKISAMVIER